MNRKKKWFLVWVFGVLLGLIAGFPLPLKSATPPVQWPLVGDLFDLGILGTTSGWDGESYGTGNNDKGQVVGWSSTNTWGVYYAFLWTPGQGMTDLGAPPDTIRSYATAINIYRQITVNCFVGGWGTLAYLNSTSGWLKLERKADWSESKVYAINNAGVMAGGTHNTDPGVNRWQPCRWSPSGVVEFLGDLGGSWGGEAYGINSNGWVVGKAYTPDNAALHAFLWKGPGQMIDLGAPTNYSSFAMGINDSGYVVGYVVDGNSRNYAVMWTPSGSMQYLGSFPDGNNEGQAMAINNRNEITGKARGMWDTGLNIYEVWHTFLYTNGQMLDLGTIGQNPLAYSCGKAINNQGQVAGEGDRTQPSVARRAFFGTRMSLGNIVLLLLLGG